LGGGFFVGYYLVFFGVGWFCKVGGVFGLVVGLSMGCGMVAFSFCLLVFVWFFFFFFLLWLKNSK